MIKVGMISLGCAKNQVDAEIVLGQLKDGYEITSDEQQADVIIINTCAFIESAKEEAINAILEAAELKKDRLKSLIVTGCLAERYGRDIEKSLPEVDGIIGIGGYDRIEEAIKTTLSGKKYIYLEENFKLDYLNIERVLSTPKGSAYLKICEGCDNKCSYCAIPGIRGPFRSRTPEDIVSEAKKLLATGVKEITVVAQDTSRYGKDLFGEPSLPMLLEKLDSIEGMCKLRIMYLYPDEISAELIETIKNSKNILHYVDLPVQHISDNMLRSMNRRGTGKEIREIFRRFREAMPDVIIRSTLMVGFPGETKEDYEEMREFLIETEFDRAGIFEYSKEEGTKAAEMGGQIPKRVKSKRYNELMAIQQKISLKKNLQRVGKTYETLVEGVSDDGIFYYGRTYAEAPEVDGYVYFTSSEPLEAGQVVNVKILVADEYDLTGEAIYDKI